MNSINTKRSVNVTHLMGINEVEIILLDSDSRVSSYVGCMCMLGSEQSFQSSKLM